MLNILSNKKEYCILILIVFIFLILRIPAIHHPYHQDEYKWPMYAYNIGYKPGDVPHPPLTEYIYRTTGKIFTENDFRFTPLIFSTFNLILLYIFVRKRYGFSPAVWSASFFTLSFFGVLASLTVDTDGAILPFFFLSSLIFYDLAYKNTGKKRWIFALVMAVFMFLGLMVKLSSVLGSVAIVLDFIWREKDKITKKRVLYFILSVFGFIAISALLLLLSKYIFSGFSLEKGFSYWDTFVRGFGSRNFLQTGIQFVKSLLYLSPFLVGLGLISLFPYRKDLRLFHIFIVVGLTFYLVLFDFSIGALDRYLAFLVIPLCVIAGVQISENIKDIKNIKLSYLFVGAVVLFIVNSVQFLNQAVPALYPKTEWVNRIVSLHWNFLYPFSGGSGPLGFYISWVFIGIIWILGVVLFVWFYIDKGKRSTILAIFLLLGLVYNGVFIQEYLFGTINGSAPRLVENSLGFIKNNPDIKSVIVYNDNGGWGIRRTGKYFRRMYATPQFEEEYKGILGKFSGHILLIDVPRITIDSFYTKYLNNCKEIYNETDKYISAKVLDCRK